MDGVGKVGRDVRALAIDVAAFSDRIKQLAERATRLRDDARALRDSMYGFRARTKEYRSDVVARQRALAELWARQRIVLATAGTSSRTASRKSCAR